MKKALFEIKRHNHIKHINRSMPLVALMFFVQNLIMRKAFPTEDFGEYTIFCALTICTYVSVLFYYDSKILTIAFEDRIETSTLFGAEKVFYYKDIKKIIAPANESSFSTIVLCSDKEVFPLRFVDTPLKLKEVILQLKANEESHDLEQAA